MMHRSHFRVADAAVPIATPVPAQLSAGRRGRRRRPDARACSLPFAREARPRRADALRAQRLHPHRTRRADRADHALCRNGPGHLHVDPDADRRRAGGRLEQVRLEHAPPNEKLYANPLLGVQATGNSNAIRGAWQPLRQAGAAARRCWSRPRPSAGTSIRRPAARKAARCCIRRPAALDLRRACRRCSPHAGAREGGAQGAEGFQADRHAGEAARPAGKVNGTAVFGIDARLPGMKIATLAQSPVFGGRVKRVDDTAAKAVKGVRQIVRLDDAVAVVADHMGAAKKGLAALVIEWDDGPHAKLATDDIAATSSNRRRSSRAWSRRTSAMSTRRCRARPPRSRRPTRFRSSRTRRWSR